MADGDATVPSIPEDFYRLLGVVPLVATVCYGVGWTFFATLFIQVGLHPEDVGHSTGFITVRAAVLLLVVFVVAMIVLYVMDVVDAVGRGRRGGEPQRFFIICWVWTAVLLSLLFVANNYLLRSWIGTSQRRVAAAVLLSSILALLQLAFVLRAAGIRLGEPTPVSMAHFVAAVMIWGSCGSMFAASLGRYYGQELRKGHTVQIPGFAIDNGCIRYEDATVTRRSCGLLLGQNGTVISLYRVDQPGGAAAAAPQMGVPSRRLVQFAMSTVLEIEYGR